MLKACGFFSPSGQCFRLSLACFAPMEYAKSKEVKLSPTIHASFDQLEPRDVSFCLTIIPTSGSGRCGASESEVPVATREIERRKNQEEGRPSVGAVREAHTAADGRDTATGNTRDPRDAEVAVLPWVDQAVHAGSRGRYPPPAQTFGSGVVVGCVHRDASCRLISNLLWVFEISSIHANYG